LLKNSQPTTTTTTTPQTPTPTTTTKKKKTGLSVTEQLFASRRRQSFLKMGIFLFAILSEASKEKGNGRREQENKGGICSV
jgi:hypothetical protein